jgi:hypothetical protein
MEPKNDRYRLRTRAIHVLSILARFFGSRAAKMARRIVDEFTLHTDQRISISIA